MADRKQVFVAYPSRDQTLSDTVFEAVSKANALPLPIVYEPWRFNDVAGAPLISPILEKIDESPFVVADITYLNLNVVYEIGFAIGRAGRAFLIRHKGTSGDNDIAKAAGIFDTLGYHEYDDVDDLKNRSDCPIATAHLPFSPILDRQASVYLVGSHPPGVKISKSPSPASRRLAIPSVASIPTKTRGSQQPMPSGKSPSSSGIIVPLQESPWRVRTYTTLGACLSPAWQAAWASQS